MSEATLCAVLSEVMQQVIVSETTIWLRITRLFSSQDANTIHNDSLNMGLLEAGWQMEPEPLYYLVLSRYFSDVKGMIW